MVALLALTSVTAPCTSTVSVVWPSLERDVDGQLGADRQIHIGQGRFAKPGVLRGKPVRSDRKGRKNENARLIRLGVGCDPGPGVHGGDRGVATWAPEGSVTVPDTVASVCAKHIAANNTNAKIKLFRKQFTKPPARRNMAPMRIHYLANSKPQMRQA